MNKKILAVLVALAPFSAWADGEPPPELAPKKPNWEGQIGAGFLATDGNSTTKSMNGKIHAEYKQERWKDTFDGSAVNVSGSTGTTAERYLVGDKVDYLFWDSYYAFVQGEWEKDLFGPTRERTSETAGVGRHFLTGPTHVLDAELGAGARQTEENLTGLDHNEAIGRFSGKYEWRFSEKNAFSEMVKCESGRENTFSQSATQLNLAIIGNLSAAFSYTLRHNTSVPAGSEHVDTETAINLVYDFGKK